MNLLVLKSFILYKIKRSSISFKTVKKKKKNLRHSLAAFSGPSHKKDPEKKVQKFYVLDRLSAKYLKSDFVNKPREKY